MKYTSFRSLLFPHFEWKRQKDVATHHERITEKSPLQYGQLRVLVNPKKKLDKYTYGCIKVYTFKKGGRGMITKIRTNIFLTRVQQKKLRALSKKTGAPVAAHVRRAIDEYFGRFEKKEKSK